MAARTSWQCYAGGKLVWQAETPTTFVPSIGSIVTVQDAGTGMVSHVSLAIAAATGLPQGPMLVELAQCGEPTIA